LKFNPGKSAARVPEGRTCPFLFARVVFGNEIDAEVTGTLFAFSADQLEVDDVTQDIEIFLKPSGKISRFMRECVAKRDARNFLNHVDAV